MPIRTTPPRRILRTAGPAWVLTLLLLLCGGAATAEVNDARSDAAPRCEVGSYRLRDGSSLDIGPGASGALRWRRPDGRSGALTAQGGGHWRSTLGWTDRPDGHQLVLRDCGRDGIRFDGMPGTRLALQETATRFAVGGTTLAGRLTLPDGNARVPIVVLVHGAEHDSALESYSLQREFAAGIGVFAYDKRGTGRSGGRYTQNYLTLANDAVHAAREARRLAGARLGRLGYQGGSQGGWVAPLAAKIEPVDFIIVSFGLAVSPLEEDREAIAFDMARAGHGAEVTAKAMAFADATAVIVDSGFSEGFEQLATLQARYASEPWYPAVRGNITGYLLATPAATARIEGPRLLEGMPAHHDPMPVLANLDVPQLWIFGGQDRDAPPGETLRRLGQLQRMGRPIQTRVFPDADHGMYEFELDAKGERVSTRQPEGYLRLMQEFIRGESLAAPLTTAATTRAAPASPRSSALPPARR